MQAHTLGGRASTAPAVHGPPSDTIHTCSHTDTRVQVSINSQNTGRANNPTVLLVTSKNFFQMSNLNPNLNLNLMSNLNCQLETAPPYPITTGPRIKSLSRSLAVPSVTGCCSKFSLETFLLQAGALGLVELHDVRRWVSQAARGLQHPAPWRRTITLGLRALGGQGKADFPLMTHQHWESLTGIWDS